MGIRIRIAFERLSRREREPLVEGASPCEVRADWMVPGLCCCLRPSEGVRQLAKAMLDAGLELPLDVGRIELSSVRWSGSASPSPSRAIVPAALAAVGAAG